MPLTDTAIKALKPQEKRYKVFDGRGLHIEVQPSGRKIWRIKYRFEKKEKRLTVGIYPQVFLREVRLILAMALEKLASGIDPFAECQHTHHSPEEYKNPEYASCVYSGCATASLWASIDFLLKAVESSVRFTVEQTV